jgi:ATP-dependent Zn protease
MSEAHNTARQLLSQHRDKLEAVTRRLLDIEVMEGEELRQILGITPPPPSAPTVPLPHTEV